MCVLLEDAHAPGVTLPCELQAEVMKTLKRQDLEEVLAQVVRDGGGQRRVLTTQVFSQADATGASPRCVFPEPSVLCRVHSGSFLFFCTAP
jgi:hypothetical protein